MEDYWAARRRHEEVSEKVRDFIKEFKDNSDLFSVKVFESHESKNIEYYLTKSGAYELTKLISNMLISGDEFFDGHPIYSREEEISVGQIRPMFIEAQLSTGSQKFWLHNGLFEIIEISQDSKAGKLISARDVISGKTKNYISPSSFVCDCIYFENTKKSTGADWESDPDGSYWGH